MVNVRVFLWIWMFYSEVKRVNVRMFCVNMWGKMVTVSVWMGQNVWVCGNVWGKMMNLNVWGKIVECERFFVWMCEVKCWICECCVRMSELKMWVWVFYVNIWGKSWIWVVCLNMWGKIVSLCVFMWLSEVKC